MQRAGYMPWNTSSKAQDITLKNVSMDGAAAYGWGPENDYVTTLNEHGVWVCHKKIEYHLHSNVTNITINTNTGTRVGLFEKLGSSLELENVERELANVKRKQTRDD